MLSSAPHQKLRPQGSGSVLSLWSVPRAEKTWGRRGVAWGGGEVLDRGKVERTHGHVIYWWEGGEEGGWREKEQVDSCTQ